MRILHYSLGFPPYRTGGLTKFCMDLMREQVREGNKVALLWPGQMKVLDKRVKIRKRKGINGIENYEVINPAPISYDEGIVEISRFIINGNLKLYKKFLGDLQPAVIHLHTFMGIHKNFLIAAKDMGIRIIYTTHDFFPICSKVTLFRNGKICEDDKCKNCPNCNTTALPMYMIMLLQSHTYSLLKDKFFIKKMRKKHRDKYLDNSKQKIWKHNNEDSDNYLNLRKYFYELLSLVDMVHYNSSLSKNIYEIYFGERKGMVLPITHGDIMDHRKEKEFGDTLKITYLGNQSTGKGYFLLRTVLDKLWGKGKNIRLNVYFTPTVPAAYIYSHERYSYSQLEQIFNDTDILVAPSIFYETYGFTVLEALSYGVPVIVSPTVGAKDNVQKGGIVLEEMTEEALEQAICSLNAKNLLQMNRSICRSNFDFEIRNMVKKLELLYEEEMK